MTDYRVLVTGSRTWPDHEKIEQVLRLIRADHPDLIVTYGKCPRGADLIASIWCREMGVPEDAWPADWSKGRGAGYARNAEMVATCPDECVAFIHNRSRGATHCADLAERAGIPTRRWTI